jgi:hypothetical protein
VLTLAASSTPAAWITLVTALSGALVGGGITAIAQLAVERHRAAHDLVVEEARAKHQERLALSRAEERTRQDEVLIRGAARMLSDSLNSSRARFQTWLGQRHVYADDFMAAPALSPADRQILAQRLAPEQWYAVSKARSGIELMNTLAESRLGGQRWIELTDIEFDTFLILGLRGSVVNIAEALAALASLTDDHHLTQERLEQAANAPEPPRS